MKLILSLFILTSFPKEIHIVPLGHVKQEDIQIASTVIREFYGAKVIVDKEKPLDNKYKNIGNNRYSADRILMYFNSSYNRLVLTEQDITVYNKEKNINWGVFGLGYKPGRTAVVSISRNRLGKNVTKENFSRRFRKVIIHELGHNLGLEHCKYHNKCVMHAADGKGSQIDREQEFFCDRCRKLLSEL